MYSMHDRTIFSIEHNGAKIANGCTVAWCGVSTLRHRRATSKDASSSIVVAHHRFHHRSPTSLDHTASSTLSIVRKSPRPSSSRTREPRSTDSFVRRDVKLPSISPLGRLLFHASSASGFGRVPSRDKEARFAPVSFLFSLSLSLSLALSHFASSTYNAPWIRRRASGWWHDCDYPPRRASPSALPSTPCDAGVVAPRLGRSPWHTCAARYRWPRFAVHAPSLPRARFSSSSFAREFFSRHSHSNSFPLLSLFLLDRNCFLDSLRFVDLLTQTSRNEVFHCLWTTDFVTFRNLYSMFLWPTLSVTL